MDALLGRSGRVARIRLGERGYLSIAYPQGGTYNINNHVKNNSGTNANRMNDGSNGSSVLTTQFHCEELKGV